MTASLALSVTDRHIFIDRYIYIYVINQGTCGNKIKYVQSSVFTEDIGCVNRQSE